MHPYMVMIGSIQSKFHPVVCALGRSVGTFVAPHFFVPPPPPWEKRICLVTTLLSPRVLPAAPVLTNWFGFRIEVCYTVPAPSFYAPFSATLLLYGLHPPPSRNLWLLDPLSDVPGPTGASSGAPWPVVMTPSGAILL